MYIHTYIYIHIYVCIYVYVLYIPSTDILISRPAIMIHRVLKSPSLPIKIKIKGIEL